MWKVFCLTCSLALVPLAADAWITNRGQIVEPRGSGAFEVAWRGRSAVRDFWCAAGEYVERELLLPGRTKIYRTSRVPRHAGESMSFSLSPQNAMSTGLAVIGSPPGLSAAHARTFC